MRLHETNIKEITIGATPFTLAVKMKGGRSYILNLEKWIDGDDLHRTLKNLDLFAKGRPSVYGGFGWFNVLYLPAVSIIDMLKEQGKI